MKLPPALQCAIALVLCAAAAAVAWDEFGPLPAARRAHPEYFRKGAVHRVELDGVEYWVFAGDSDRRDGFSVLSDTERYAEAALDARRNLLRHVACGASNVTAEVSGIVTAYRLADGDARRVVCLVPVENVSFVAQSAGPPADAPGGPPSVAAAAQPARDATPAPLSPPTPADASGGPPSVAAAAQPARGATSTPLSPPPPADAPGGPPSVAAAAQPAAAATPAPRDGTTPPRFQMPSLPSPVLPGDVAK